MTNDGAGGRGGHHTLAFSSFGKTTGLSTCRRFASPGLVGNVTSIEGKRTNPVCVRKSVGRSVVRSVTRSAGRSVGTGKRTEVGTGAAAAASTANTEAGGAGGAGGLLGVLGRSRLPDGLLSSLEDHDDQVLDTGGSLVVLVEVVVELAGGEEMGVRAVEDSNLMTVSVVGITSSPSPSSPSGPPAEDDSAVVEDIAGDGVTSSGRIVLVAVVDGDPAASAGNCCACTDDASATRGLGLGVVSSTRAPWPWTPDTNGELLTCGSEGRPALSTRTGSL